MDLHHPKSTDMHHFPGYPFTPPLLFRGGRLYVAPSSYQPPYVHFQPMVLAYPASFFDGIGHLTMSVLLALDTRRKSHAPPVLAFAPASLAVLP